MLKRTLSRCMIWTQELIQLFAAYMMCWIPVLAGGCKCQGKLEDVKA